MPGFSDRSLEHLATLDPRLQAVLEKAIRRYDFAIICGHRGKDDQDKAVREGRSKLKFPLSKHNQLPSLAVDVAPYPIDWKDIGRFKDLACVILETACRESIPLAWGGNWKSFKDYPHFEIPT